jgi:adenylylsulfate kinase
LAGRLRAAGHRVEVLDGDELRQHLTADLGFSRADRDTNVRRVGYVARLLARHGVIVLVPVIAPYAAARAAVRELHEESSVTYVEVHVATPVEVCAERDVKGLYAQARAGTLRGFTGVDDPYEPPPSPDLRLDTAGRSVEDTVAALHGLLVDRRIA